MCFESLAAGIPSTVSARSPDSAESTLHKEALQLDWDSLKARPFFIIIISSSIISIMTLYYYYIWHYILRFADYPLLYIRIFHFMKMQHEEKKNTFYIFQNTQQTDLS